MIIALAGRRIDAPGAEVTRFPLQNVRLVQKRIRELFVDLDAEVLVSSAACGADLVAIGEADRLEMSYRIILPFEAGHFRSSSVTDRPGEWGNLYDGFLEKAEQRGDLVVLTKQNEDADAYAASNLAILEDALTLGKERKREVCAVLVWDAKRRAPDDVTALFGEQAREKGITLMEIETL